MKKIVTCEEMKKLDGATIHHIGVASEVLMERAALKEYWLYAEAAITEAMVLPLPDCFI